MCGQTNASVPREELILTIGTHHLDVFSTWDHLQLAGFGLKKGEGDSGVCDGGVCDGGEGDSGVCDGGEGECDGVHPKLTLSARQNSLGAFNIFLKLIPR